MTCLVVFFCSWHNAILTWNIDWQNNSIFLFFTVEFFILLVMESFLQVLDMSLLPSSLLLQKVQLIAFLTQSMIA